MMVEDSQKTEEKQDEAPQAVKPAQGHAHAGQAIKGGGVIQFLKECAIENNKITWPDRAQVIRETWSVLVLVTALTLIVLGVDWILGNAVFGPIEHWARLYGAGFGRG